MCRVRETHQAQSSGGSRRLDPPYTPGGVRGYNGVVSDQATNVQTRVDEIYRSESRRVFATLVRLLGDFDLAEEALHDAFASALKQWPAEGVPANPRAWLVSAGRFKAIDAMRRRARFDASLGELAERIDARTECGRGREMRRRRRRSAAADLHVLPSGARAGGASGAHAARSVRADDRGDRARVSGDAGRRWPSGSCGPRRRFAMRGIPYRGAVAGGSARAAGDGAAGRLPRVQRRLLGIVGRIADARRSVGRSDSAGHDCWWSCCRRRKSSVCWR